MLNLASAIESVRQFNIQHSTFNIFFVPFVSEKIATFASETLKEMKTYEKERDYSTTLDSSSDDDVYGMCCLSTGG